MAVLMGDDLAAAPPPRCNGLERYIRIDGVYNNAGVISKTQEDYWRVAGGLGWIDRVH